MTKKKVVRSEKKEICWNLINSGLAGALIFLGALTAGNINAEVITAAVIASLIVFVTRFRDYWSKEENEYSNNKMMAFKFL